LVAEGKQEETGGRRWRGNDERKKISPKTQMIEHFSEFSCKRGKIGFFSPC